MLVIAGKKIWAFVDFFKDGILRFNHAPEVFPAQQIF